MSHDDTFAELLRRVRAGDDGAAAELVRSYEPVIRLAVRARLGDRRLRRTLDSMDVCQSVLASFFVRVAAGQYDLGQPEQLAGLLVAIARNKVAYQARRQRAGPRDVRRDVPLAAGEWDLAGPDPSPSRVACGRELLAEVRRRLSAEERHLADLRAEGRGWTEIAAALGGTAAGRRMQLARALGRVTGELGLEAPGGE